jgi:hypothetical protein
MHPGGSETNRSNSEPPGYAREHLPVFVEPQDEKARREIPSGPVLHPGQYRSFSPSDARS